MHAEITPYRRFSAESKVGVREQVGAGAWIVLSFGRNKVPMSRTQDITRSVRAALIAHADEPVAPVISGHGPGDDPTSHLGVLVLPNVTNPRSDGLVQGVALMLPAQLRDRDRASIDRALANWRNSNGHYELRLPGGFAGLLAEAVFHTANPTSRGVEHGVTSRGYWARTAHTWSTVTPVVLDRHPKTKPSADFDTVTAAVAPIVADMCERSGLPRPRQINVSRAPVWPTVPVVGKTSNGRLAFPVFRVGGDGPRKFTTHVGLVFPEPVQGPIVLGAGRYFGYGLLYPTPTGAMP